MARLQIEFFHFILSLIETLNILINFKHCLIFNYISLGNEQITLSALLSVIKIFLAKITLD